MATAWLALVLWAMVPARGATAQVATPPEIVPRAAWGARPADTSRMRRQTPRGIVIHHTAERQRPDLPLAAKLRRLQRFAQAPGVVEGRPKQAWGDLPYHFYIDAAGRIGEGRDLGYAGDSNTGYDPADRIQIVLEGHFGQEQPTPAQLSSLDRLVVWLAARYRIGAASIAGHDAHAATECPGRHLKGYLPVLRSKVAKAGGR